jgi:hypothetical protein
VRRRLPPTPAEPERKTPLKKDQEKKQELELVKRKIQEKTTPATAKRPEVPSKPKAVPKIPPKVAPKPVISAKFIKPAKDAANVAISSSKAVTAADKPKSFTAVKPVKEPVLVSKPAPAKTTTSTLDKVKPVPKASEVKKSTSEKKGNKIDDKKSVSTGKHGVVKPVVKKKQKPKSPETVKIYSVEVPVEVRSLKQRLKEELQIATATRRLHFDEMEEIRQMEKQLKEKERALEEKMRQEREEAEARKRALLSAATVSKIPTAVPAVAATTSVSSVSQGVQVSASMLQPEPINRGYIVPVESKPAKLDPRRKMTPPSAASASVRISPQASPRRLTRHKRQNSDPMVAKFSPIEEIRDIENDMQKRLGMDLAARGRNGDIIDRHTLASGRYIRRLGTVTPPARPELEESYMMGFQARAALSKSSELLNKKGFGEAPPMRLSSSHSETHLPLMADRPYSRTPTHFSDDEDMMMKTEKKHLLQAEIENRKRRIEENARLQHELRQLTKNADITPAEFEEVRKRYQQHIQARERMAQAKLQAARAAAGGQQGGTGEVPAGIIRPLDYDFPDSGLLTHREYAAIYREMLNKREHRFPQPSYSSTEYLAHKERSPAHELDALIDIQAADFIFEDAYNSGAHPSALHYGKPDVVPFQGKPEALQMGSKGELIYTPYGPQIRKAELGFRVPFEVHSDHSPIPTETDTTPASDQGTPAMPLLGDVTLRSRNRLRDIGSRPLSDDMDKYFFHEGK